MGAILDQARPSLTHIWSVASGGWVVWDGSLTTGALTIGTVNQGGAPWTQDVTRFGGNAVQTGAGAAGNGVPRVTVSDDDTSVNSTINGAAQTFQIALAGRVGVSAEIQAGTLAATITYEQSYDGGVTWVTALVLVGGAQSGSTTVFSNPNAESAITWYLPSGASHARIRVTSYTSGSAAIWLRATKIVSPLAVGAISCSVPTLAVPSFATYMAGQARTSLPTANSNATLSPIITDAYGRVIVRPANGSWAITHDPAAAATQATISRAAAGAGVKNVCTSISITLSSTAAPTAGTVLFNLRDGATGAGTVLQTWRLSLTAVAGDSRELTLGDLWIEGTANTAMTLECAAAPPAANFATVSLTGTTTQ